MNLGLSGRLTKAAIGSPLTPLFLLAALAVGLIALLVIPREEEPQISVPMVDIRVTADGLKGPDAVELVCKPLESIVKGIDGVDHVYSQTQDDRVMVTARFLVGTKAEDAILRVHEKVRANMDRIPVGIPEPLIVGRGINDVAIVVLTLSPKPEVADRWTDKDLYQVGNELRAELMKVDNVGLTYISGGSPSRSASSPIPRSSRCTASRCSSLSQRCATPTARSSPARYATPVRRGRSRPARPCPGSRTSACCW